MSCSQRLKTSFHGMRSSDLSVHQVVNSDDIMSEIFLLLPPETVYKLILVSKRWLQIISNSFFRRTYLTKWQKKSELLGFFICKAKNSGSFKYELRSPSYSVPSLAPPSSRTSFADEIKSLKQLRHYIDSSNGFILCSSHPDDYYLWNPTTRRRYRIPHPKVHFDISCTSLIIEDSHVFSYKVIRADWVNKASAKLKLDSFSSKTNTWSYSEVTCPEPMILILGSQKVINGVVYWYANGDRVAIYGTNNKEEKRIDLVKLPKIYDNDERVLTHSADGCLQYGRCSKSVMEIWKLEKVNGGVFQWKHQHKVNFKVVWRWWYNAKDEKIFSRNNVTEDVLAFPIRNETNVAACQTCSSKPPATITEILIKGWKKKKTKKLREEKQCVPYGMSAMSCHSFDDLGFPFFFRYSKRADVSEMIGKKLLRHYMSS